MKIWDDITKNQETQHTVAIDLFKAVCFIVGILLMVFATIAKIFLLTLIIFYGFDPTYIAVDVPTEPAVILLLLAFGLQNSKMVLSYFNRKTADGNNNALATAASAGTAAPDKPVLMPQQEEQPIADVPLPS